MNDKTHLELIYENMNNLKLVSRHTVRDGGSQHIEFSDGLKCMFDFGMNSPTKGKFVKSWKDRTVIDLPDQYIEILKKDKDFSIAMKQAKSLIGQ